jgi:DNA-binding response OmpR family regulator
LTDSDVSLNLPLAVEAAIERSVGLAGDKPVAVIAEYPAHLPAAAGEHEVMVNVIASLIAYAVSITNRGEIRIRAELLPAGASPSVDEVAWGDPGELSAGGPWALVRVRSSGSSLLEQTLEEVSQEVEGLQHQQQASRDSLSLAACQGHVEEVNGHFWIEGLSGEGLRLNLALPLKAATPVGESMSSLRRMVETRLPEGSPAKQSLLLFVEDAGLRDYLARDLVEAGYRVLVESEGANVLALARTERPDLLLLDLDARDPSAFDIAMVLKQDTIASSIPLLFITSVADPSVGVRMEAVDFVVRPSGTGKLLGVISEVLSSGLSPASSRVLVIEPDDATREAMILMIQSHGYRVTEAKAPEEAMALAERLEPRLVLVNFDLALERDYWLLRGLRQLSHDLEVFVLAEALSDEEGRAAISRGASGYSETGRLRELLDQMRKQRGLED